MATPVINDVSGIRALGIAASVSKRATIADNTLEEHRNRVTNVNVYSDEYVNDAYFPGVTL
jgi:hypothetical protein